MEQFRHALSLLPQLPDARERMHLELELSIALGGQLLASAGWGTPEAERLYARAQELCSAAAVSQDSFAALWGLWMYRWGRAELSDALRLGKHLECVAVDANDEALRLQAHHAQWATSLSRGDLDACCEHASAGAALYDSARHGQLAARFGNHDPGSCALHFRALAQALRGEAVAANRDCRRAIELTSEIGHPFSQVIALFFAAAVQQVLRDVPAAEEFATRAVKLGAEHGFTLLQAWATVPLEWAAVERGAGEAGCQRMREAIERAGATGTVQMQTWLHAVLAEACMKAGRTDSAREAARRGLEIAAATEERFFEAELLRLSALLSDSTTRRELLLRALELARAQGARLLAVRAEESLGP